SATRPRIEGPEGPPGPAQRTGAWEACFRFDFGLFIEAPGQAAGASLPRPGTPFRRVLRPCRREGPRRGNDGPRDHRKRGHCRDPRGGLRGTAENAAERRAPGGREVNRARGPSPAFRAAGDEGTNLLQGRARNRPPGSDWTSREDTRRG